VGAGVSPFRPGQEVTLQRGAERRIFSLHSAEVYRDKVILQLEGVTTAREAAELAGSDILLPGKDLVDLPEGTYYIFRLVGLEVLAGPPKRSLGRVQEIISTGGTDVLRVRGEGEKEWLIPFARSICRRIDPEGGVIEIDPPEGLLELDAI
jgi:16S rRNA processing protein RimM